MSDRLLPLVYIAGPITAPNPMHNTYRAVKVGSRLQATGLALPLVPHLTVLADMIDPQGYEVYMEYDLALIRHVHAVFRLAGESPGADREVEHAHALGIPVFCEVTPRSMAHAHGYSALLDFCGEWIAAHNNKETA